MLYELLSLVQPVEDSLSSLEDDDMTPSSGEGLRGTAQDEFLRSHPRAVLNELQAIEIYQHRRTKSNSLGSEGSTAFLAKKYNVSPKTIRDIWNRRTWIEHTRHLWTDDEKPHARKKMPMRPKAHAEQQSINCNLPQPHVIAPRLSVIDMIPFAFAPLLQGMHCNMPPVQRAEPMMSNITFAILSALLQSCPWPAQQASPAQPATLASRPAQPPPPPPPECGRLPAHAVYADEELADSDSAGDPSPADADAFDSDAVWACESDGGDSPAAAADDDYDGGILSGDGLDELASEASPSSPSPSPPSVDGFFPSHHDDAGQALCRPGQEEAWGGDSDRYNGDDDSDAGLFRSEPWPLW
jgi:hypothetical protein